MGNVDCRECGLSLAFTACWRDSVCFMAGQHCSMTNITSWVAPAEMKGLMLYFGIRYFSFAHEDDLLQSIFQPQPCRRQQSPIMSATACGRAEDDFDNESAVAGSADNVAPTSRRQETGSWSRATVTLGTEAAVGGQQPGSSTCMKCKEAPAVVSRQQHAELLSS